MAARDPLSRDRRGRFLSHAEQLRRLAAQPLPPLDRPWEPAPEAILAHPTDRYPRYRLRVFDLCWPWRASRSEAVRDALASGNAHADRADGVFLDCVANIQRDPPFYLDQLRVRRRREGQP